MTDKEARDAAYEAFGGLISTDWANASDWEREEVRRSVDAAIDAYLTMSGYVRKPSREELANTIADTDALTGIGMRWFPSSELTPQAYAIADAILTLLQRTDR